MPHRVVNETDMRAPALIALDLPGLVTPRRALPEDLQVHIDVAQIADRLAQFAGPDPAVEVDDG